MSINTGGMRNEAKPLDGLYSLTWSYSTGIRVISSSRAVAAPTRSMRMSLSISSDTSVALSSSAL